MGWRGNTLLLVLICAPAPVLQSGARADPATCLDVVFADGFEGAPPAARISTGALVCVDPLPPDAGCVLLEECGLDDRGNGLDDNCNGMVDESCSCLPGSQASCFSGPPGKRGVGTCADGMHSCMGSDFTFWTECAGSVEPSVEICADGADNDCNSCIDD